MRPEIGDNPAARLGGIEPCARLSLPGEDVTFLCGEPPDRTAHLATEKVSDEGSRGKEPTEVTDTERRVARLGGLDDCSALEGGQRKRLLAEDMRAVGEQPNRDWCVQVIRRSDDRGVDLEVCPRLPRVIPVGAERRGERAGPLEVSVHEPRKLGRHEAAEGRQVVVLGRGTAADQSDAQAHDAVPAMRSYSSCVRATISSRA